MGLRFLTNRRSFINTAKALENTEACCTRSVTLTRGGEGDKVSEVSVSKGCRNG